MFTELRRCLRASPTSVVVDRILFDKISSFLLEINDNGKRKRFSLILLNRFSFIQMSKKIKQDYEEQKRQAAETNAINQLETFHAESMTMEAHKRKSTETNRSN